MNCIDKLFQLKYLSLRGTDMSKLPSGISRLYGLETLDIRNTYIKELPSEIVHLIRLQHLLASGRYCGAAGITEIPNGIGNMKSLRAISGFNVIESSLNAVEELGNLTALEELYLQLDGRGSQEYKRHEDMLLSSLCKLGRCKLQSLWIYSRSPTPLQFLDSWSPLPSSLQRFRMTNDYYFPKMPKWIVPELTSLAYLNINLIEITEEDLCILGEMSALLSLDLTFKVVQKEKLIVRSNVFPCLKEFKLDTNIHGKRATYLKFEERAMPKLEKLDVQLFVSAAKDYGFNFGIDHLPCLKHAVVRLENHHATYSESKAAAAAIRNEANAHPNRPRVFIYGEMRKHPKEIGINKEESYTDEEKS